MAKKATNGKGFFPPAKGEKATTKATAAKKTASGGRKAARGRGTKGR